VCRKATSFSRLRGWAYTRVHDQNYLINQEQNFVPKEFTIESRFKVREIILHFSKKSNFIITSYFPYLNDLH
jgi:hypothetical protein